MPTQLGGPPTQTPETDSTTQLNNPEMGLYGFTDRMKVLTEADHAGLPAPTPDTDNGTTDAAETDSDTTANRSTSSRGQTAKRFFSTVGSVLAFTSAAEASANSTNTAEIEKQTLAAFGSDAVTRSIESFAQPEAQASTQPAAEASASRIGVGPGMEAASSQETEQSEGSQERQGASGGADPNQADDTLKQLCVRLGLAMPNVNARMVRPGNDGGLPQSIYINLVYRQADRFAKYCKGKFIQLRQVLVQMQTKNRKGWLNLARGGRITKKKYWKNIRPLNGDNEGSYDIRPAGHSQKDSLWNRTCRSARAWVRNSVFENKKKRVWVKPKGQRGSWEVRYPLEGRKTKIEPIRLGGHCKK